MWKDLDMAKVPVQPQDKYVLRMPDGMRERIKKSAERNGRSMNAEIVQALEMYFPPEPSMEDVLEKVHRAIEQANQHRGFPYRQVLVDALDALSEQLGSGLEFDQFQSRLPPKGFENFDSGSRMIRWRRAQKYGVDQHDLEREIKKGMLRRAGGDVVRAAIKSFDAGKPERALRIFRLHEVKFADPEAALKAIENDLREYYQENWGDIDETPPWEEFRD